MPTTTWEVAREEITRPFGAVECATTTNIATNNYVISTELSDNYPDNDYFIGWYVLVDGTINNLNIVRRVTDYVGNSGDSTSGRLTISGAAFANAESAAMDCTLMRFAHERVRNLFNRARQDVHPHLGIIRDLRTLVTGQHQRSYTLPSTFREKPVRVYLGKRVEADSIAENLFTNGGFETWAIADGALLPTGWTNTNHASINQEEETTNPQNYMVLAGSNSARCVLQDGAGGVATLLATVTPTVAAQNVEVNVSVWVYATTSARISARAVSTIGDKHGGTGWELLKATAVTGYAATTIAGGTSVTEGEQISYYADEAIMVVGQSEAVEPRWDEVIGYEWIPPSAGGANGGTLEFNFILPEKEAIRIVGTDLLSSVSADTDTIEIDGEFLEPLYDRTRQYLCEEESYRGTGKEQAYWWNRALEYKGRADLGLGHRYISLPNPRIRSVY